MPYQAGLFTGVFLLINSYLGLGLLCIPRAAHETGWLLIPVLVVLNMLSSYTAKLLLRCFPRVSFLSQMHQCLVVVLTSLVFTKTVHKSTIVRK